MQQNFPMNTFFNSLRISLIVCTLLTAGGFLLSAGNTSGQRAITNPSIEQPAFPVSQFFWYDELVTPGWLTTHPVRAATCTNGGAPAEDCRPIERWSTGFSGVSTATGAGTHFVELNAYDNSMIYQNVCMTSGESFNYSFLHRGRASETAADTAQFRIGIPDGLPAGSKAADTYSFPIVQVATTSNGAVTTPPTGTGIINAPIDAGGGWRRYSGTYTYAGASQAVNIGFVAIGTAGGSLGAGNFIDDWQITLNPYLEFSPSSASGPEGSSASGNTPANRPAIRIGGTVPVPIVVTVQVTGGSATAGDDYSMTEPFQEGVTTPTAAVTIPAGTYDGVSAASTFPIPFSISADFGVETDETVEFSITSAPGATIASVESCGAAPSVSSTYSILNDDLAPTSDDVTIAGRVVSADGRGIPGADVRLVTSLGFFTATTSSMGYFSLEGATAGDLVNISVRSKRHFFKPSSYTFVAGDDVTDLIFRADCGGCERGGSLVGKKLQSLF